MKRLTPAVLLLASLATAQDWKPLFDGKTLEGWKSTPFRGGAEIRLVDGAIQLPAGEPLTGASYTGSFPKADYEIRFEARRVRGGDFFASLTLPVGESFGTWVLGGWGGDIVGFSSIDGWDASDNETRSYFEFEPGRWYRFRIVVTKEKVQGWIGNDRVLAFSINGREISMRPGEIEKSAPLGFASYRSEGEVRQVEWRAVQP